ncbi:MAG: A/G-specific adenine glycosylase, partial [Pedosphaera sp.]|nr:A/G-specific adenine glycosylase [Pedosphaera sp.]MST00888.1 A/G-specific adenine glycosylase [Pedosphaera sp.]
QHNGRFPQSFDSVLALPGIGRYTAGAICSIAYNLPTPILDGNVIRVLTRLFGIGTNPKEKPTNEQLWTLARALVEAAHHLPPCRDDNAPRCSHLNQSLMELGALICTPQNPRCADCPVRRHCVAHRENRTAELPSVGPRTKATARRFIAFVVERDGTFLARQRPAGVVNAHLWEFPNAEADARVARVPARDSLAQFAGKQLGLSLTNFTPLATVRHSITRYRITLETHRARWSGKNGSTKDIGRWLSLEELHALAFTSAHRKILERLQPTAVTC